MKVGFGGVYSSFHPALVSIIVLLAITEYVFAFVAASIGILICLVSLLAVYGLLSFLKVSESMSTALENVALLFVYVMLVSALPWFFFRQDLLIPAVYSVVLALCFWRIHSKNLSLGYLGFVRKNLVKRSLLGVIAGIPVGIVEYFILRPMAATPTFSYVYFIQTAVYMFFFVGLGEELLFRSLIQNSVIKMTGLKSGIFLASVIFGVMHFVWRSVPELFFTFAAGLILGVIYWKTGSLAGPLFLHASNNVILLAVMPYLF